MIINEGGEAVGLSYQPLAGREATGPRVPVEWPARRTEGSPVSSGFQDGAWCVEIAHGLWSCCVGNSSRASYESHYNLIVQKPRYLHIIVPTIKNQDCRYHVQSLISAPLRSSVPSSCRLAPRFGGVCSRVAHACWSENGVTESHVQV